MKTRLSIVLLFSFLLSSFGKEKNNFKIIGKAHNFPDSTFLYLVDADKNVAIDSTYIINESFSFTGFVSEPKLYSIHTKFNPVLTPPFQYKIFWVTDTVITLDGTFGNFFYASVNGSSIHKQQAEYESIQNTNNKSLDSLMNVLDNTSPSDSGKYKALVLSYDSVRNENKTSEIAFIRQHPDYFLSSFLLAFYTTSYGKELTGELYKLLSDDSKASKYGKQIRSYLELNKEFKVGDKIDNITLPDQKGDSVNLYSIQSAYTLVEFWSSGCGPCRSFNSKMAKDYTSLKKEGLEVFSVSLDKSAENWLKASETDGISWVNLNDKGGEKGKTGLTYGISYIPTNYLVDANKEIVAIDVEFEKLAGFLKDKKVRD
jgi:thiol-disulfide isomerase/thioredoxin